MRVVFGFDYLLSDRKNMGFLQCAVKACFGLVLPSEIWSLFVCDLFHKLFRVVCSSVLW